MKRSFLLYCATLPTTCLAQDLAINNARIIDGSGHVIERGSVLIRDDRVVAVGTAEQSASRTIDARQMTVIPGMIDTHVHLITGPAPASHGCDQVIEHLDDTLAGLLQRGFTTIFSPGDEAPDILTVRERLTDGDLLGPRLLAVGPVLSAPNHPGGQRQNFCDSAVAAVDEEAVRAHVREMSDASVDGIKIIYDSAWPPRPDDEVVAAITGEAHRRNLAVMAHVQTVDDALQAVQLGVDRLVHLPSAGSFDSAAVAALNDRGVRVSSTVHLWAPIDGPNDTKRNHDGREYTAEQLQQAEAGLAVVLANVRALWDAGIPVAFGTDAYRGQNPAEHPIDHEIETLGRILSPEEIIAALTRNGAAFLGLSDELGTIEPGRLADMVIIDGDPLVDPSRLANVKVVIKAGEVVVDAR